MNGRSNTGGANGLREAVEAVEILSESAYDLFGEAREVVAIGGASGATAAERLVDALAKDLYDRLYTGWGVAASRPDDPLAGREHVAALSRAHRGRGTWEPGWRVRRVDGDGRVVASKGGLDFWAAPGDVRCRGPAEAGKGCRVRIPGELRERVPGFYLALGDADRSEDPPEVLLRLYWHLRADAAARWVGVLGGELNERGIPFRLKVPDRPRHYRRTDAGVLYLDPGDYGRARSAIRESYRRLRGGLREGVPWLTFRLAPGLALAEGSGDGSSFGQDRCRLVARALASAFERGGANVAERLETLAGAFRERGLDPRRPYLAAGSTTTYETFGDRLPSRASGTVPEVAGGTRGEGSFVEAARRIGDALCREAYRSGDRCNWIGAARDELDPATGALKPAVAALGPDLYAGTAGVGLFLAELHRQTGDGEFRRTAVAALRQATGALGSPPYDDLPSGFYAGRLGIAWAARRVAALTGDRRLTARSEALLRGLLDDFRSASAGRFLDLLSGHAGTVPALLALYRETGDGAFLEAAEGLGEEVLRTAVADGPLRTWPDERVSGLEARQPLTGYSHGAAGLGLALLELYATVRRPAFLAAARGAFAYEDAHFRSDAGDGSGNWPDFRTGQDACAEDPEEFMTAWCHGAPGIALSRLRAMALDLERATAYEAAARAGLETTRRRLVEGAANPDADASLCHGLSGLADVLRIAATVLGEPDYREQAEGALGRLLARHGARGTWPSGVPSRRRNPSLMLGEAGIGYTFLRLADPDGVPSPLSPGAFLE